MVKFINLRFFQQADAAKSTQETFSKITVSLSTNMEVGGEEQELKLPDMAVVLAKVLYYSLLF